jgi:ribosomal protein S18 acetylase RimI-like enzyme
MIYRRPSLDEAEVMAALHVQCWQEAYANIVPQTLMLKFGILTRLPMWETVLADNERIVLGAYDEDKAVGFIIAGKASEDLIEGIDGHIAALYISASHYRMGIGRELIAAAAKAWLAQGGKSLALGVLAENIRARSFYEALGARLMKLSIYEWDGHPLPDAIYIFEDLPSLIP